MNTKLRSNRESQSQSQSQEKVDVKVILIRESFCLYFNASSFYFNLFNFHYYIAHVVVLCFTKILDILLTLRI